MKLIQKGLFASALMFHASLWAAPLGFFDFRQLIRTLNQGNNVCAIVNYDRCELKDNEENVFLREGKFLRERFNFHDFTYERLRLGDRVNRVIVTTRENIIPGRNGELFRRFTRLRIFDDNTAEIYSILFSMNMASQYGKPMIWRCQIGQEHSGLLLRPTTLFGSELIGPGLMGPQPLE